jgi:hypothetical protein
MQQRRCSEQLFDHLVSALLEKQWYINAKRVRRLEIHNELEFRGLFYWHVWRFITLQNLMYKQSAATKQGWPIRAV